MKRAARYAVSSVVVSAALFIGTPMSAHAEVSGLVVRCDPDPQGLYHRMSGVDGIAIDLSIWSIENVLLERTRDNDTWDDDFNDLNDGEGPIVSSGCATYGTMGSDWYAVAYAFSDRAAVEAFLASSTPTTAAFSVYPTANTPINWSLLETAGPIDWTALQYVATSSSLFSDSTTTLELLAERCDDSGNIFSRGLCYAGTFLFVPNPSVLDSYAELPRTIGEKFPFSWVYTVADTLTSLSASSSTTTISVDMSAAGIGSTTAIGNILPNFTVFSYEVLTEFMPAGVWDAIQALMAAALWIALGLDVYHTIRKRHSHV